MINKLKDLKSLVKQELNKDLETMYVVADFSKMNSIVDYESKI